MSGDIYGCPNERTGATSTYWVEARDGAKQPVAHRRDPTTTNSPVQIVLSIAGLPTLYEMK